MPRFPSDGPRPWSRLRFMVVLVVLGVATVVFAPVGGDDEDDPAVFSPFVDDGAADTVVAGQPFHIGLPPPDVADGVELRDATVRLGDGTVPVATEVSVCTPSPRGRIETTVEPLAGFCRQVAPVEGAVVGGDGDDGAYLVATVVPLGPGSVRVEGVVVRHGAGVEATGAAVTLTVVP